ncbi:hypothetical protein TUBRATIS_10630, partial [Tubulinosema ratisbonensis]
STTEIESLKNSFVEKKTENNDISVGDINESKDQKEEKNDYFKYAEIFFENLDRKIFWKSVEKNLIYVLEENFSDGIKGGKKSEKESEIINEEEIEEIDKD